MKFRCKQLGSHENRGAYEKFVGAFVSIRKIGLLFLCWDTCIRMSKEEYALLKEKSRVAGLSANAWLMRELE